MLVESITIFELIDSYVDEQKEKLVNNDVLDSFVPIQARIRAGEEIKFFLTKEYERQRRLNG